MESHLNSFAKYEGKSGIGITYCMDFVIISLQNPKITNLYRVSQKKVPLFEINFFEFSELLRNQFFCIGKRKGKLKLASTFGLRPRKVKRSADVISKAMEVKFQIFQFFRELSFFRFKSYFFFFS